MNKKKIFALCLVICLLATAVVGGTLAYFTDTDAAKNVMTIGNVEIQQHEQQKVIGEENDALVEDHENVTVTGDGLEDFEQNKKLFPMVDNREEGDPTKVDGYFNGKMANVVDKIVSVTNTGSEDAYVRTILAFETQRHYAEGSNTEFTDLHDVYFGVNTDGVEYLNEYITIDGVEYVLAVKVYDEALAPDETSGPSLKQFFLAPTANNETTQWFGNEYTILAVSQGVQTAGFEPELDADGNVVKSAAAVALDRAFGEVNAANAADWFAQFAALPEA